MTGNLTIYIDMYLKNALSKYIIDNNLDYKKITIQKLSRQIIKKWLEEKRELDDRYIFFKNKSSGKEKLTRMALYISDDDSIELNRIFIRNYTSKVSSMNMLAVNILEQWAIKNIKNYLAGFREIEREKEELIIKRDEERIEIRIDTEDLNDIHKYIDSNRCELKAEGINSRNKLLNKIVKEWISNNVI